MHTGHDCYDIEYAKERTMTVGKLIEELSQYDEDDLIVYCNDNGYTYGYITDGRIVVDEKH